MSEKKVINISLSRELYNDLKRLKAKTGHNVTTIVRLALLDYLRKMFKDD